MLRAPQPRPPIRSSPYRTAAPPTAEPRSRWSGAGQELMLAALLLVPAAVGVARGRFGGLEAVCLILAVLVARATWRWVRAR